MKATLRPVAVAETPVSVRWTPKTRESAFCFWLSGATPGDINAYHRGFLTLDNAPHSRLQEAERLELLRVSRRAYWAMETERVHLLQRRHGVNDYSYLAVARRRHRNIPRGVLLGELPPAPWEVRT